MKSFNMYNMNNQNNLTMKENEKEEVTHIEIAYSNKEELDELVNEYIDHFDSQGWSLYPRLFEGSLSEWREEGK